MGRLAEMQRKLLEQMMGPEAMGVANANLHWQDEKVCRNYLCGICPHVLFTNTKMDLGACPKSHMDRLKTEFNQAKEANPNDPIFTRFQNEYENNIFSFVDECDRRIRAAHRRLEKTPEENAKTTNLMREIAEIELAIQGGTEKIEQLGEQGKVDESMREMAAIEALKSEKADKERELQQLTDTSGASGHQKLRVCDVCGAYLSVLDSDRRLADHFGGKMHLGYHELRNMLQKFKEEREQRKLAPPPSSSSSIPSSVGAPRPGDQIDIHLAMNAESGSVRDHQEDGDIDSLIFLCLYIILANVINITEVSFLIYTMSIQVYCPKKICVYT
ncbi:small nuclear ribonucleo [Pyrrhoderma noxium]|uniref:Small nuclear ribonucleo n=1 Tax=Pyrrhoderma noxium TaxID=2282107 RepID=A0A286UWS3_9AGAM|nr:small nuclear ribonucleo [Pyrrhoderma noxium]